MTWTIAADQRHLLRDGQDDFLLADTLWAALHRADDEGFRRVVQRRAQQGFTGLMMSLLPIAHDRSGDTRAPFHPAADGEPDFSRIDQRWLHDARARVELVRAAGLTPVLMLQWVNYVPGTWGSADHPHLVMDREQTRCFVESVVPAFRDLHPIWSLSGDDTFTSRESVEHYRAVAPQVRRLDPDGLVTLHTGGWHNFPAQLDDLVDFVGFQSGHDGANWQQAPATWNHYLDQNLPRRPRMNLEPPYEGHGYNNSEGRYLAREVRIASWRSVLAGAGAGLGYGAHGLWSWHHRGEPFSSEDWSSMPFDALAALEFPGADDVAWLRQMVLRHQLWRVDDRADLVVRTRFGIQVGADAELSLLAIYAPHAFSFEVQVPAHEYEVQGHDVVTRRPVEVSTSVGGSGTLVIDTPLALTEHLYVLTRR